MGVEWQMRAKIPNTAGQRGGWLYLRRRSKCQNLAGASSQSRLCSQNASCSPALVLAVSMVPTECRFQVVFLSLGTVGLVLSERQRSRVASRAGLPSLSEAAISRSITAVRSSASVFNMLLPFHPHGPDVSFVLDTVLRNKGANKAFI